MRAYIKPRIVIYLSIPIPNTPSLQSLQSHKCLLISGSALSSPAAVEVFRPLLLCGLSPLTPAHIGLGKAFAKSLIKRGKKVYIAGRTESNVSAAAKEIGAAGYFVVDFGDVGSIPAFVEKVTKEAPEIDCLLNNAGIQVRVNRLYHLIHC